MALSPARASILRTEESVSGPLRPLPSLLVLEPVNLGKVITRIILPLE
jgi:hypothetical protein